MLASGEHANSADAADASDTPDAPLKDMTSVQQAQRLDTGQDNWVKPKMFSKLRRQAKLDEEALERETQKSELAQCLNAALFRTLVAMKRAQVRHSCVRAHQSAES